MTTEKKLSEEDAHKLAALARQLTDLQTKYGQHAMFCEEQRLRAESDLGALRAQAHQKTQELHSFSQQLMQQYSISPSEGPWSLDVDRGVFLGPDLQLPSRKIQRAPKAPRKR